MYNEISQHSEDLNKSVNQYFPNDQRITLQNHALVKDPFSVHDRSVDSNTTEYTEFICMFLDSTWQLTFKNYHL